MVTKIIYRVFYEITGKDPSFNNKKINVESFEDFTSQRVVEGQELYNALKISLKHKYKDMIDLSIKIVEIHNIKPDEVRN